MNRDPLGLGVILYGFRAPAGQPTNLTLLAAGWSMDALLVREFELAHEGCSISTFCRNPLHPGPCKGWRKKLGTEAPGALKAIKSVEGESLAKRRAKLAEAKSAAGKKAVGLHSPLHAKKATAKHANVLLGNDEAKAKAKAAKVILNKQEIKKYSKIKAAHMNSIRTKHGLTEDPGLEDRLAEALAKDNTAGHDENYRAAIGGSAASLGAQLADKHCKKGDGDCDGIPFENLRETLSDAAETALLTGDDSELDAALDDYAAGKTPKASKPPAASTPRPAPEPEPKPKPAPKAEPKAEPKAAPVPPPAPTPTVKAGHTPPVDPDSKPPNKTIGDLSDEKLVNAIIMVGSKHSPGKEAAAELERRGLDLDGKPKAAAPEPASAPAAPDVSGDGKPTMYKTIKQAGLKSGDQVVVHTAKHPNGKPATVTVKKQSIEFHDEDGNLIISGGVATKWNLSAPPASGDGTPAAPDVPDVPEAPSAPATNAEKAQVGMKFGLGLMALTKGNKTLGTKAQQKHFADRAQAEMDGDPAAQGVIKFGAEKIAQGMMIKATKHPFAHPTPKLSLKEQDVIQGLAAEEIEQGIKGDPGPFPVTESLKKAVNAWHAKDYDAMKEASTEFQQHIKAATAKKIGVSPDSSAAVVAAHILFKPGGNMADGKSGVRAQVLGEMSSAEYVGLPEGHKTEIKQWLDGRAEHAMTTFDPQLLADTKALQRKLGLPEHGGELGSPEPVHSPAQAAAINATNDTISHAEAHAAYDALSKDEFDALEAKDRKVILSDLAVIANDPSLKHKADVTAAYLKGEPAPPEPESDSPSVGKAKAAFAGPADHEENISEKISALEKLDEAGFSELPVATQNQVQDFLDHQLATAAPGSLNAQDIQDIQAKYGLTSAPSAPKVTHLQKLKEMFGDDGSPNHQEVVKAIFAMDKNDWDGLTPEEKKTLAINLDDARNNGEPGANSADGKIDGYLSADSAAATAGPTFPNGAAPAKAAHTSPDAKKAGNYALGVVSGTAKQKLVAYEKVTGPEFQQLTPVEQKAILDDLEGMQAKFLDPKKIAQAKSHKDYLSGFSGGGAGAGGATHTTAPGGVHKVKAGTDTIAEMIDVIHVPNPGKAKSTSADLLSSAETNGTYDQVAVPLADMQAGMGMDALSKIHTDANGPLFDAAAVGALKPELAKDIVKKLKGETGPTPVYAAWLKAMKSGSQQDAQDLADTAFPPFGGTFGVPTPPDMATKHKVGTALQDAWSEAGLGAPPAHAPSSANAVDAEVNYALSNGTAGPTHQNWANSTGEAMAHTMVGEVYKDLGLSTAHQAFVPTDVMDKAIAALKADFADKLLVGGGGTGAAVDLKEALASAKEAALHAQTNNGWAADSQVLSDLKASLLQADLEQIVAKYKPVVGNPNLAAPTVPGTAPLGDLYSGPDIKANHKGVLFSAYKSAHKGTVLSHSNEDVYNNLLAVASHYAGSTPGMNPADLTPSSIPYYQVPADLSVLDVAKAVDVQIAKSMGKYNENVLTKKIDAWAKTPAGAQYIKDHPQAGQKWLDNLAGNGTGSEEAKKIGLKGTEPVGKRAQRPKHKVPAFDASKTAADFHPINSEQAAFDQQKYMDDNDANWTPGQTESLSNYTTGSYHELNAYLRGKHADGTPVDAISSIGLERIALNQAGMRPLQRDSLLKRGTGWEFLPPEYRSAEGAKKLIGKSFVDDAFVSTTAGGESGNFNDKVLLMIEAPKGTPGAWVREISHNQGENEIVLAAGTKFKIISVEDPSTGPFSSGTTTIRVRVVPS